jgi:hypothetical protein
LTESKGRARTMEQLCINARCHRQIEKLFFIS